MDLFRQVLSEYGREVASLIHSIIERDSGSFQSRLVADFSNGHRAVVAARGGDFYQLCVRLSTGELDSLCSALVSEGRAIYAHMIRACELHDNVGEQEHHHLRLSRAEPIHADTPDRLHNWWTPRWAIRHLLPFNLFADRDAHARGTRLLIEGGETGKRYRIRKSYQMNVEELGNNGKRMRMLCFMPKGGLVLADVMLAQKLALELFDSETLAIANTIPGRCHPLGPPP
jgi:hypothetical protein